jgi:CRISPR/Cas system-associated protein Cas10 (large subunit of type III CRISPR-Cas system)
LYFRSFGQSDHGKLTAQKTCAVMQNSFNPFAQQQQQQQTKNNEQPFFTIWGDFCLCGSPDSFTLCLY